MARVLRSLDDYCSWRDDVPSGETVGFVPTMGALHEGHLSLIRAARERCRHVVVSVFVNPTQFAPDEDLDTYPRDEAGDVAAASSAGADVVLLGTVAELYPDGFSTRVEVDGVSAGLCARTRPHHFGGVAVIVLKLFQIVRPREAFFGKKDYQQLCVIRRMVRDLHLPVVVHGCPIVREPDGLAMSSRNVGLSVSGRQRALALSRALNAARERFGAGERDRRVLLDEALTVLLEAGGVELEYLELVDEGSLAAVDRVESRALLALAARVDDVRLIDNVELDPGGAGA